MTDGVPTGSRKWILGKCKSLLSLSQLGIIQCARMSPKIRLES